MNAILSLYTRQFHPQKTSTTMTMIGACMVSYWFIYEIMTRVPYLARLALKNYSLKLIENIIWTQSSDSMPDSFTREKTSTILAVIGVCIVSYWFIYEIMTRVPYFARLSLKNYVINLLQIILFEYNDLTLYQTVSLAKNIYHPGRDRCMYPIILVHILNYRSFTLFSKILS